MKRIVTLVLIISLLLSPKTMFGIERRGAIIEITKIDRTTIGGELIGIKQNGRFILEAAEEIDALDILIVTIIRKSGAKAGSIIGAIIGIPLGVVAAISTDAKPRPSELIDCSWLEKPAVFLFTVAGTAFFGFLVGAFIGGDSIIRMEGIPQKEKDRNLEKLRSVARFPEYR